jgi:23S rRNA (uridine2552-2'-O)-methyltransferase
LGLFLSKFYFNSKLRIQSSKLAMYQPKDAFYRRAKKEGYRSRAAYKLLELNRRFHIIKTGDQVVDLGAAPGGWLQVASQLTGKEGRVVGIDLEPIEAIPEKNIVIVRGDITSEESVRKIQQVLGKPADCAISDVAPRLSGIRDADLSRSMELNRSALKVACHLVKPGGHFLVKVFMGEELKSFRLEIEKHFLSVQSTRPEATRKGSSEIYLCAKGLKKEATLEL